MRKAFVITGVVLFLYAGAASRPAAAAAEAGAVDPKLLEEMAQDVARFAEAVKGYRAAANNIIKRGYADKIKSIKGKYDPLITLNEKEERERRLDAIAMFEAFLRKYPSDKRWTPDAMFRLAELYYEKSSDEFLATSEEFQKALDSPTPPVGQPPKADYLPTVNLYKRLLTEFPNYRLLDATYYLLGFCLGEMGQEEEAKQALLALTCSNRYKPLDPPPPPSTSKGGSSRGAIVDTYKDCVPVKKDSKFLAEAWTRVGEMHFDAAELGLAISAYGRVLDFKDSSYYDKALYKLAWSYYRDNRFPEAIREFDGLVKWADERKSSGEKFGSDLRPEAVQYLGVSFQEADWDGDTVADPETGLARLEKFYQTRENEPHVREVYQRLGDLYFDQTKYPEAIAVYRSLLTKWPYYVEAPQVQEKIVRSFERDRNLDAASKEREVLGRNYTKGTAWYQKNLDNPEAIAVAQQLAEDALLVAATNVHAAAQACKDQWQKSQADVAKQAECKAKYKNAGELYEKYLAAYPNSKRAYEFSNFYADALYFSDQFEASIGAYTAVRDSNLDNRYQVDAAFQVIKAYEAIVARMKAAKQIEDPPVPDEKNTKPPVTPIAMPEVYQKYLGAIDWYVNNLKDDRVPDLKYAGAVLVLRYKDWPAGRARLQDVATAYCGTKSDVGFRAYDAILQTYFIDYNVPDEEQKDCALGKLLLVTEQFGESPCAKSTKGAEYIARIKQLKASVKSTVITQRVKLAIDNENAEAGKEKQLITCKEGDGGVALITGTATGAKAGQPGKPGTGGGNKLSTEIDAGMALDLLDLVNQNPTDQDSATNLNNACVIYERLFQYGEATKCYERLSRDYQDSKLGQDAVWNAAVNHRRFFEFDDAVKGYLKIATDPKFAQHEHRKDALGLAAQMLDNDQQYLKAADLYKRYADAVADKPQDSGQAYKFACEAFEKAKDYPKYQKCLNELVSRFGSQAPAGDYVIDAYLKKATLIESQTKDKKATLAAYQKVRDEFLARRLPPATPAAAAAAKADFLLMEEKFNAFANKQFRLNDTKKAKAVIDGFIAEAKALGDEYAKIWEYKDATWTLASFLKRGDLYYAFAQKLIKAADTPPDEIKSLGKKACRADPSLCGEAETQYKDAIFTFVTPVEDKAKEQWKSTLAKAAELSVTNDYVKKARENLSKYLPDEFPFIKDERIGVEYP